MDSIIIGNGLLAKAFLKANINNCLFFCSGVSNSSETREEAFDREKKLLINSINQYNNKCIVYFSSISAPKVNSPYFNHKINMENIIVDTAKDYIILRLPQVAGAVVNSTLLSFITQNIYLGKSFKVFKNATRTIVDVEDIVKITELIYIQSNRKIILNICPKYSFEPEFLVQLISKELGIKALYEVVDEGFPQTCELNSNTESQIISDFFSERPQYLENLVNKYVNQITLLL